MKCWSKHRPAADGNRVVPFVTSERFSICKNPGIGYHTPHAQNLEPCGTDGSVGSMFQEFR